MLPEDVLLQIFDFRLSKEADDIDIMGCDEDEQWIRLAHVCRRWRNVVLQSPRHLNPRLLCTNKSPAMDILEIWPPLPLIIRDAYDFRDYDKPPSIISGNIVTALEHNDRVCEINPSLFAVSQLELIANSAAMQKPFPVLTRFWIGCDYYGRLPDSILGGNAPRLRSITLIYIIFPGLPKLLLSTTQLVKLDLNGTPSSGYIPPEAMATSLSASTSLEKIRFIFESPRPRPALESQRPPPCPLTRSILPSLTWTRIKSYSTLQNSFSSSVEHQR